MLRRLTVLTLALATPLVAQVPTTPPPVTRTPPAAPVAPKPPATPAPSSGWRVQSDDYRRQSMDVARQYADLASVHQDHAYNFNFDQVEPFTEFSSGLASNYVFSTGAGPRAPWAKADPADSLYRSARELLNRGDYRRAAAEFKAIPAKFPNSVYADDAMYWQAFALYRIGGTPELQEALGVLETLKARPSATEVQRSHVGVASSASSAYGDSVRLGSARAVGVPVNRNLGVWSSSNCPRGFEGDPSRSLGRCLHGGVRRRWKRCNGTGRPDRQCSLPARSRQRSDREAGAGSRGQQL